MLLDLPAGKHVSNQPVILGAWVNGRRQSWSLSMLCQWAAAWERVGIVCVTLKSPQLPATGQLAFADEGQRRNEHNCFLTVNVKFHRSIPFTHSCQGSDIMETHHLAILMRTGMFWKTPAAMDSALLFSETVCCSQGTQQAEQKCTYLSSCSGRDLRTLKAPLPLPT